MKYKIINEEQKNILEKDNYKPKNNSNKSTQNLIITGKDIYNIVEKLYSYNFETINKNEYNLEIEKEKLKILEITSKLIGYNFNTNEFMERVIMTENEINNLINLVNSKEDYIIVFLTLINNYRSTGKYELPLDIFNIIKKIFDKAADNLLEKDNNKISNFLIILSQTFYVMKDDQKHFLQKDLNKKVFFQNVDFWLNKLDNLIGEELERFETELIKNDVNLNEKKKEKKKEEILFTKFISFITSLNGFELNKEKVDKILFPLIEKYNVKEEMKNSILPLLDVYKNNA